MHRRFLLFALVLPFLYLLPVPFFNLHGRQMPTQDEDIQAICHDIGSRQRYRAGPKRVGDVVNELMARRGYAQLQSSAECADAWRTAAGTSLASHTVAGNIRRGVLEVFARNSAVVQELTFRKKQLIAELTRLAPDSKIRDVRFRVGPVD